MEKFFSVSQAAKKVNMTAETLRYYDRIGLVHPSQTNEWSKYRYYSEKDIVRLNTVRALSCMEIPLKEIKRLLDLNDIEEVIGFLKNALDFADKKLAELQDAKERIIRAKEFYESKREEKPDQGTFVRTLPARTILLSDKLSQPTIDNLWDYHRHFFSQVGENKRNDFEFEDLAGVYEKGETKYMFAVCKKYSKTQNLIELPQGRYLCAECTEISYNDVRQMLTDKAKKQYKTTPGFVVRLIVLTGILQWKYEVQVFIGER